MRASSPFLQKIFQSLSKNKHHQNINVTCEVTILHVYKNTAYAELALINPMQLSSYTPNLLGLERMSGDPDNSALTGANTTTQFTFCYVILYILIAYVFSHSLLWPIHV